MKRALVAFFLVINLSASAWAEDAKLLKIKRLIAMTGGESMIAQMQVPLVSQMITKMRAAIPGVPESAWTVMEEEMGVAFGEMSREMTAALLPVYDERFSEDELDSLIAFWETPAGRKLLVVTPDLMVQMTQISQSIGPRYMDLGLQRTFARWDKMGLKPSQP